ncbi:MAG: phenylacetic acid degradation bifunctional protein PaaZ [Saprospiraceae bacterium]|jgi:oxepin-CoA hydrolase/3-oxo-5,6-dehydrosuberyl-CoA semialdehyde dehydrogenase|nr:phenylacetic acid degradation bifunctional protein PaaZ [Saprospiraceae bacterium]
MNYESYVLGGWQSGSTNKSQLYNAITSDVIGEVSTSGFDFKGILDYARTRGGAALRKMTFQERGLMLKKLALFLLDRKEKYYEVSYWTGATKIDSWIDIEGGIGNLFANASLRRKFGDQPFAIDGDMVALSKGGSFIGHHILVPKHGVALHINAFNFPIWGMLEKIAVNLLAGVPAVVKPASITCYLTEVMVRDIVSSKILPEGSLQLISGSVGDLLDHVTLQDVVTFTGSAQTGLKLKSHPRILAESVPFNMEADSLNCMVLGDDAKPGTPDFDVFLKEVRKEITVKAGQKCTAVRRIFVPENYIEDFVGGIKKMLSQTTIGNPQVEGVKMGSLAGKVQREEVLEKLRILQADSEILYGDQDTLTVVGADKDKGAFISPFLLFNNKPFDTKSVHEVEAFGPIATVMPYKTIQEAVALSQLGKGSLCSSIITSDVNLAREYTLEAAPYHGRILVLNNQCAKESTGHGSPMPLLVHGGPGRAGGGEEMGGSRGVKHYMQRTAVQGSPSMLSDLLGQYQQGGEYKEPNMHVFRKHFEELEIGETVITHKRTITDTDIVNFGNVSWDHFYAHTDVTSLDGTIFEQKVAHGYFILSAAAGLFVDPAKGPVLLNYGLEDCRFIKPVYAGMTIGVRLTVKEKISQELKPDESIKKGIVKYFVDVYDETGESVAIATILTMVKCKD